MSIAISLVSWAIGIGTGILVAKLGRPRSIPIGACAGCSRLRMIDDDGCHCPMHPAMAGTVQYCKDRLVRPSARVDGGDDT